MKRLIAMLSVMLVLFLMAGCGGAGGKAEAPKTKSQPAVTAQSGAQGKVLVAYYSASGHTRHVAELIAAQTKADIFEIVPEKIYTEPELKKRDPESRVSKEHNDPNRTVPLKNAKPASFEQYRTVFVAYPIWYHIAAWPVDGFIKANDFTGKTVIPVATARSSDLGESAKLLQQMTKTPGNWQEGTCFKGKYTDKDVADWVASLAY